MKNKRIIAVFTAIIFVFAICGCSGAQVKPDTKDTPGKYKTAKQIQFEKDEEVRGLFIKSISSFTGLLIGGLIGLLTASKENAVTSSIGGCVAGGALGFGLGLVIFDNTQPGDKKVDEGKVKEYFQDYRNIQLKE